MLPPSMPKSTADDPALPSFLRLTEPLDLDQVPLQLALVTMELASLRQQVTSLSGLLASAAERTAPSVMIEFHDG